MIEYQRSRIDRTRRFGDRVLESIGKVRPMICVLSIESFELASRGFD